MNHSREPRGFKTVCKKNNAKSKERMRLNSLKLRSDKQVKPITIADLIFDSKKNMADSIFKTMKRLA